MEKLGLLDIVIELGTSRTMRRTHIVVAAAVLLTDIDHAVDWKILWPILVSMCSRSLFWLFEFNSELFLMRLYLVMSFCWYKVWLDRNQIGILRILEIRRFCRLLCRSKEVGISNTYLSYEFYWVIYNWKQKKLYTCFSVYIYMTWNVMLLFWYWNEWVGWNETIVCLWAILLSYVVLLWHNPHAILVSVQV